MIRTDLIRTVPELLGTHSALRGDEPSFRDDRQALTWAQLGTRTARLAAHLGTRVERGGVVAICMGNRVEAAESYLAVTRASAVGAFLNPGASDRELAYMLADCGAALLITDAPNYARTAGMVATVIVVDGPAGAIGEEIMDYATLVGTDVADAPADDLRLDEPAWMLYTSGTTGQPKGVVLTQRTCLWVVAACWAPVVGLSPSDDLLSSLPLFHSYALDLTVLGIVATGASARLLPRFSTERIIELLRSESATLFAGVPTMFHYLVAGLDGGALASPTLRLCVSAGAILPASLAQQFETAAGVPLLDGYGITETSTMVTMNWPSGDRPAGSCGLPLPGCAVRLVDPISGSDVALGAEGEVIVRGPQVMAGYHNKPDETARVLRDGWYHTGDLGRSDVNGYLTITGRIKELIIRGGENIYPAEVEQVIAEHPDVSDAAVIGRPDEALGEVVVAFVVPRPGADVDPVELTRFVAERVAGFKVPAIIHVIDEIPRTGSGKIMRHRLSEHPSAEGPP